MRRRRTWGQTYSDHPAPRDPAHHRAGGSRRRWLVAFTASFDEFALALFLAGPEPTLPVFIYGQLRFASRFPMLIALAVLVIRRGTLTLAFLADRLRKRVIATSASACRMPCRSRSARDCANASSGWGVWPRPRCAANAD